jgi:hypothetical protein
MSRRVCLTACCEVGRVADTRPGAHLGSSHEIDHYANDELLTGDDIADALVDLAAALAKRNSSLSVDIPVQFGVGDVRDVNFLLGPASQLIAVPAPDSGFDELVRTDVVERLRAEERRGATARAFEFPADELGETLDDLP